MIHSRVRTWCTATFLLCAGLAGCAQGSAQGGAQGQVGTAQGPGTPGWTGSTVVTGNNSTIGGDAAATYQQQKWPYGDRR